MFALGGLPALLVSFIRYGVKEPKRWENKSLQIRSWTILRPLAVLFMPEYRKRTLLNSMYVLISIVGLWAGSVYVPAAVTELATRQKMAAGEITHLVLLATMLLAVATILGCIILPPIAERLGRRATLALYSICMMFSIAIGFGYLFICRGRRR